MAQQVQDSLIGSGSSSKAKRARTSDRDATKSADRRGAGRSVETAVTQQLNREEADRAPSGTR
jgi:hypothetical protein